MLHIKPLISGLEQHKPVGELPKHSHSASSNSINIYGKHDLYCWSSANGVFSFDLTGKSDAEGDGGARFGYAIFNSNHSHTISVNNTGDGNAHNNMPPYLSAYIWKRIA